MYVAEDLGNGFLPGEVSFYFTVQKGAPVRPSRTVLLPNRIVDHD